MNKRYLYDLIVMLSPAKILYLKGFFTLIYLKYELAWTIHHVLDIFYLKIDVLFLANLSKSQPKPLQVSKLTRILHVNYYKSNEN